MQDQYFSLWLGKWTTAIDWTAAVAGTYVSATLSSLSQSVDYNVSSMPELGMENSVSGHTMENEVNKYFSQSTASYFGEEAFAVRMQAFDDMLWIVLEWLESIKFIKLHSSNHHELDGSYQTSWHARQFIPTFAHRARVFYQLAEQGWDWHLCGGGMTWNPRLLPYKNAITNQLFISASISMYLHFPGDDNCSPFLSAQDDTAISTSCSDSTRGPYNPSFRQSAINGYIWLKNSGMLNAQGLYTDGFHISDYRTNKSATTCDERNEMVYTYNQGVILSGLRGLWEATGNSLYLADGYELMTNVVKATGWNRSDGNWHGLGVDGVLMEACDLSGGCNQDGQTFKGLFFHHLTAFCEPLPTKTVWKGSMYAADETLATMHEKRCEALAEWVVHNAQAALRTRDAKGRFGGWWSAPSKSDGTGGASNEGEIVRMPVGAIDYRNHPELLARLDIRREEGQEDIPQDRRYTNLKLSGSGDLNDRGRGRTVETQGSGLAVVRAMYEFLKRSEPHETSA